MKKIMKKQELKAERCYCRTEKDWLLLTLEII